MQVELRILLALPILMYACGQAQRDDVGDDGQDGDGTFDSADGLAPDVASPGSLAACAELYTGFETCCRYDEPLASWVFENQPCYAAQQCIADADCPAGAVETGDEMGDCWCVPSTPEVGSVRQALTGTRYCPETSDRAGCPCDGEPRECCLGSGRGLACYDGVWQFFWDCPCYPGFGCDYTAPDSCRP